MVKNQKRPRTSGYDPDEDPNCSVLETSKKQLTIDAKIFSCVVKKYDIVQGTEKATITVWHCNGIKIPYSERTGTPRTPGLGADVVRVEVDVQNNQESTRYSLRVVKLREERMIGKKNVLCVRAEGEMGGMGGKKKGSGKITYLLSDELPGHVVEMRAEGEFDGKEIIRERRVEDFEVVKEK
jgi:hypothetical protein